MAYRNPRYAYLHAARDVGVANLKQSGTAATGYPLAHLIDDRMQTQHRFSAAAAGHYVQVDLGASYTTGLNRLYIPNHNLAGAYTVEQSATDWGTPTTLASGTATAGTTLDVTLSPVSSQRYLRFTMTPSGAWQMGQLWYSTLVTTTRGPDPAWVDELEPSVVTLPNGDTLQTEADRRSLEYVYHWLTGTDLQAIEGLVAAVSSFRPFILDTAYDVSDGGATLIVKLRRGADSRNDSPQPAATARQHRITLQMLESLA